VQRETDTIAHTAGAVHEARTETDSRVRKEAHDGMLSLLLAAEVARECSSRRAAIHVRADENEAGDPSV
jgi:hypothetical protein